MAKKTGAGTAAGGDWLSLGWVFSYPLMAVFAAMIFLSAEEISQPAKPLSAATVPVVADSPDWGEKFAQRVEVLHAAVVAAPLDTTVAGETAQGSGQNRWKHRLVELTVERERQAEVEAALDQLRTVDDGVNLVSEDTFNGTQVLIGLDGLLTHTVRIFWADEPTRPRVGLVIAALGDDLRFAREVIELKAPVGIAILPFRPFSAQVAELARLFERDVLLDWSAAASERHDLEAMLGTVPGAFAVHLGAAAVETSLVGEMRDRGLFPLRVDSNGGPTVFAIAPGADLDRVVEAMTRHALEGGRAIGVTWVAGQAELARVRRMLSDWRRAEIDVVEVSELVGVATRPAA